jgi:hypothetical protein
LANSLKAHSTHRVAKTAFWRTFHHDGKISLGYNVLTITYKVAVYAPAERADTLLCFISPIYVLCA